MRIAGFLLASLGGCALAYMGMTLVGNMIIPPAGAAPGIPTRDIAILAVGGLCVAIGISVATRRS